MTDRRGRDSIATGNFVTGIDAFLDHCSDLCALGLHRLRVVSGIVARSVRLVLVAAGVPLKKPFLVLACYGDRDDHGLFSEFASVLGLLEHHEKWRRIYAGLKIEFTDQALYFDPAFGPNWWAYYFEPIAIGSGENAPTSAVDNWYHARFAWRIEQKLSRKKSAELVARYIRVKPEIMDKVDTFVSENFKDSFVIGVHYRGTDKVEENPRVTYEDVCASIRDAIRNLQGDRYRLFLATDEQAFVEYMLASFPGRLTFWETLRSVDGTPNWISNENNYRKGRDAVMDCLLLSRANLLIRTESNLSMCSALFNPGLPVVLVNRAHP